ncbi:MAG: extracellular solute-binding protein [Paracoccaceae bacterium]
MNTSKVLKYATLAVGTITGSAAVAQDITLNVWADSVRVPMFETYDKDGVDLNITTISAPDLVAKIQLAMQAGTEVPDVVFFNNVSYTSLLATRRSNFVLDLSDLIPQEVEDAYSTNANTVCEIDGKLMCLRNDVAQFHIWYNAPLIEELGETLPTTWEEYEAFGARVAEKGMSIGSATQEFPMMNFLASSGCNFAAPVEGEENTLRIDLSTESCLRPAEMVDRMAENGSLARVGLFDPAFAELYRNNKVPFLLGPSWFAEHVIRPSFGAPEGQTGAALPPRWADQDQPTTWHWGGGTYAGWRNTEHPEAVADLIEWVATDVTLQTTAVTMPAHEASSVAWGAAIAADPWYANDQTYNVMLEAVQFSDVNYVSLRINLEAAFAGTVGKAAATGESVVGALPALEQELTNQAKLNGYTVVK